MPKAKNKKPSEQDARIEELTADLQRTRADFENYRKRVEQEKSAAREAGKQQAIVKLLPVIDNIERAVSYLPEDLADHKWAQGVAALAKNLDKTLAGLQLAQIKAEAGMSFNPDLHEAVQMDEDAEGDKEVISEVLQAGYQHNGVVIRPAMVKVTRH